jgi:hypothetical protein
MTTKISAVDNPQLVNQIAEEALSDQVGSQEPVRRKAPTPPDTTVELVAGLMDPFEGFISTAEVRELTGADEEAIAKAADIGRALMLILERAVVRLGDKPAEKDVLDMLLAGDREMLLLAIRRVTFGDEVIFEGPLCSKCPDQTQTLTVGLNTDVKLKKLESDKTFNITCKVGTVEVSLPTGHTQKSLVNSNNKTAAELDTIVLKSCVKSINGIPLIDGDEVRNLGIKDRRDILKAISDRNPGPQLDEITKPCQFCGSEVPLPLTLASLFQE